MKYLVLFLFIIFIFGSFLPQDKTNIGIVKFDVTGEGTHTLIIQNTISADTIVAYITVNCKPKYKL